MANIARVVVSGRLTKDIELMSTKNDTYYTYFSVASSYYSPGADRNEGVSFFNVKAFGKNAEFIKRYFSKGDEIIIDGQLREDRWEKNGEKRSQVTIYADSVFFGAKKQSGNTEYKQTVEEQIGLPSDEDCPPISGIPDLPF